MTHLVFSTQAAAARTEMSRSCFACTQYSCCRWTLPEYRMIQGSWLNVMSRLLLKSLTVITHFMLSLKLDILWVQPDVNIIKVGECGFWLLRKLNHLDDFYIMLPAQLVFVVVQKIGLSHFFFKIFLKFEFVVERYPMRYLTSSLIDFESQRV